MTSHTVRLGDAEIISVTDGHLHFAPSEFFPSVDAEEWERYSDHLSPEGLIRMNVGSFVVRVGGTTALIDTGLGRGDHPFDNAEWGLLEADLLRKGRRQGTGKPRRYLAPPQGSRRLEYG